MKKSNPLFVEYLLKFWTWDESDYIRDKLAGVFNPGKTHVADNLSKIKNHVVPFFDPNLRIRNVTTGMLEDLKKDLLAKKAMPTRGKAQSENERPNLASRTVSEIIQAIKKPLREAKRLGIISVNPADAMTGLAKTKKGRGILTSEEIQKVFSIEWRSEKSKLASQLACLTGLRAGEIGALRPCDLRIVNGRGIITIAHSFERVQKMMKGTKNEKIRYVCVPAFIINDLLNLHQQNIHENGRFIFWGISPDSPMRLGTFLDDLRLALNGIGISYAEQKERNITFHSWRHYYNSALRGSVPDEVLRKFVGHEDESMTDNYDHVTDEQIDSIYKAMEAKILPFVRKAG